MDTRRNLKYSRAFPYVGAQRLGMLRPSQREPTQESALREYAILHRTPNSGAPRPSLAVSILFLATALSTIPADAAELMIGGGGLSGINALGILGSIPTLTPPGAAIAMPTPAQPGAAIAMPTSAQPGAISDGRFILPANPINPINPTRLACQPLTQTAWDALRRGNKHRYNNALAQYNACVDAREW